MAITKVGDTPPDQSLSYPARIDYEDIKIFECPECGKPNELKYRAFKVANSELEAADIKIDLIIASKLWNPNPVHTYCQLQADRKARLAAQKEKIIS